jgi:hypothetical protein
VELHVLEDVSKRFLGRQAQAIRPGGGEGALVERVTGRGEDALIVEVMRDGDYADAVAERPGRGEEPSRALRLTNGEEDPGERAEGTSDASLLAEGLRDMEVVVPEPLRLSEFAPIDRDVGENAEGKGF